MRKLGFLALIPLSAGVIGLTVGALWLAGSSSGQRERFSSLEIAPADAVFYMAINTDPTSPQWLAVNDSLDAINAKDPLRQALDDALAEFELEWERDIIPVAGDEAFVAVPDIEKIEGGRGFIAGVRTQDNARAQDLLDRVRERSEREGEEFKEEEYEGVTIIYVAAPPDLDGDPATSSDCEVDASNTLLCDEAVPIPEDPVLKCMEIMIEVGVEGSSEAPAECQPLFSCPTYTGLDREGDLEDLDGNGIPDSCDEVERMKLEWEKSIEFSVPYQDCADLEDITDYQCQRVPPIVVAQAAGVGGAVAIVNDVLVVGGEPDDVKPVIDVVQGRAPSAATNERLVELQEKQTEDFLTWGYADLEPVWDTAESLTDFGANSGSGFTESTEPPVRTVHQADYRVTSFDAEYTIHPGGALEVKETIAVDFGEVAQRGIIRELPVYVSYDFTNDELIRFDNFVLMRDGVVESSEGSLIGDHFVVTFGDKNSAITGQHTYEFTYKMQGGINQSRWGGPDAYYELRWVATGDRWPVSIDKASATVNTPDGTIDMATCHVGAGEFGEDNYGLCQGSFEGQTARFVPDAPFDPGAGLHFFVGVNGESGALPPELVPAEESPRAEDDPSPIGVTEDTLPFPFASEELFDELRGRLDRVGFSVSSMNDGFAFDLEVLEAPDYEPKEPFGPFPGFEPKLAERLPADTMFYLSAFDIYNRAAGQAGAFGDVPSDGMTTDDFLSGFRDETGIDMDQDLLSLLTGEFAFAGDVRNFDAGTPDFELTALADVSDEAKASGTLEKLGEYLQNQDLIEPREEGGSWQWSLPPELGVEPVGWAVRDGKLIVGYPDGAVAEIGASDDSLAETGDWQRTLELLPDEKIFVGFVSVARLVEEIRKTEGAEDEFRQSTDGKLGLEDLEAIRSVGFSANTEEDGFSFRSVLFVEKD